MKNFNEIIKTALDSGSIYNVDYQDVKSSASSAFDHSRDVIRSAFFHAGAYKNRTPQETEIDNSIGYNLTAFPSKKLVKLLSNAERTEFVAAVEVLVAEWKPVSDNLKALKPMVVKGRKPSETPRMTPERTLENTGTCSVCGRNVKLRDGKIVDHGFALRFGFRNGMCPGVGFDPIEVSPEGLHAYQDLLVRTKQCHEGTLAAVDSITDVRKRVTVRMNAEQMVRWLEKDIEDVTYRIIDWKASPLPDAS